MRGRCLTCSALVAVLWCVAAAPVVRAQTAGSGGGIQATLRIGKERQRVRLLGMKQGRVLFTHAEATHRAVTAVKVSDVESADIKLEYDKDVLSRHLRRQDWEKAAQILFRAVYPAVPFLVLKGNKAVPLALRTGDYLMKAGALKRRGGRTAEDLERAATEYRAAHAVLSGAAAADWSTRSRDATFMDVICLVMLGKLDEAESLLAAAQIPFVMEDCYALYRLAGAHVLVAKGDLRQGIEEAVGSLVFETKDLNTFPDALMLSAHCYEGLEEWHRARDVYYEVARLYRRTHWEVFAKERLTAIMAEGRTTDTEQARVENVFFGIEEDVNEKVRLLLNPAKDPAAAKKEKGKG